VIHERRGETAAAIKDYQTAVRYNPQYEPSLKALARLNAQLPQAPRSDVEKRAVALADQAAGAARRGDYAEAARKLDEAESIAPRLALIQQYRANVAYLKGDKPAAVAALKKGLALEPDNALFREKPQAPGVAGSALKRNGSKFQVSSSRKAPTWNLEPGT
jgi:tetratricopeptide (TPR) repeat protein